MDAPFGAQGYYLFYTCVQVRNALIYQFKKAIITVINLVQFTAFLYLNIIYGKFI